MKVVCLSEFTYLFKPGLQGWGKPFVQHIKKLCSIRLKLKAMGIKKPGSTSKLTSGRGSP